MSCPGGIVERRYGDGGVASFEVEALSLDKVRSDVEAQGVHVPGEGDAFNLGEELKAKALAAPSRGDERSRHFPGTGGGCQAYAGASNSLALA